MPEAFGLLESCLALAEPEGYIRVFIEGGEPIKNLLAAYLRSVAAGHTEFAQKILDAFSPFRGADSPGPQPAGLIEPLTERELEVLQYLAKGFSNQQVAAKLYLSVGTVKFHVHSILEKIQVHSRAEAIVQAQHLKLI
jgi:LuxR family maltose regulon positive regulatory protein